MTFPVSYGDPLYDTLAAAAEQKYGLPTGILNAIRLRGERSNANQISPAGARTPYQFIPATRQGFIKNYGIDPWADPTQATDAAAIHLSDDYKRTGSWDQAIARYYGGQHPGVAAQKYQARVGEFDNGANSMGTSLYPVVNGVDPLAPEPPLSPVPIAASAGPSVNVGAASPVASHKRGGILGALESVFMPDPSSLWAGALRDGVFNAKESQRNYLEDQQAKVLNLATANQKLKDLMTKGEYQVVGNNVVHYLPGNQVGSDGKPYEIISPPSGMDDKIKYAGIIANMPEGPAKELMKSVLLGNYANTPEGVAARNAATIEAAKQRAGATVQAARIRGPSAATSNTLPPLPPGAKVIH